MNTKNIVLSISALIISGFAIMAIANSVFAYQGDSSKKGPNYTEERHAAMEKAFESNDYAAWKNQMQGRGRVTQVINEGNFAKFSQMHELMDEGKTAEANAIRTELGLGTGGGQKGCAGSGAGCARNAGNCPMAK